MDKKTSKEIMENTGADTLEIRGAQYYIRDESPGWVRMSCRKDEKVNHFFFPRKLIAEFFRNVALKETEIAVEGDKMQVEFKVVVAVNDWDHSKIIREELQETVQKRSTIFHVTEGKVPEKFVDGYGKEMLEKKGFV